MRHIYYLQEVEELREHEKDRWKNFTQKVVFMRVTWHTICDII